MPVARQTRTPQLTIEHVRSNALPQFLWRRKSSDLELMPIDTYLQKPGDFLGNRYMLRVQIDEQLKWEKGLGRVLAVVAEGSEARLPVFVPESAGDNLHVGQRYELQAIIEKGGLIYVEALQKY